MTGEGAPMPGLRVSVDDGVCVAVIDNPGKLNALDDAVMAGLLATCARVDADPDIRVLVLTGEGRAFCAGADIGLLDGLESLADARDYIRRIRDVYVALDSLSKPLIAAVNGYALGGGLELCLCCDLVIASENAAFALPEVLLGAIPGFAVVRLPQIVGRLRAAELMMLGDRIPATEAHRIGLVNRVVEPERLMEVTLELAHRLARGAPLALQAIKATMRGSSTGADMTLFLNTASGVLVTEDAKGGMRAFAEKREPRFEGR
jgi:enoyl-CoA hydratase/carnithine racemase